MSGCHRPTLRNSLCSKDLRDATVKANRTVPLANAVKARFWSWQVEGQRYDEEEPGALIPLPTALWAFPFEPGTLEF